MKICIDARMYGVKHAGIGRYVENLVANVLKEDRENNYVLLVRKEDSSSNSIKYPRKPKLLIADARHYTVKEQLLIPYLLAREKPDLVHFPHFNVPLLYPGKFVVTIHDLLWHEMKGKEVTTLPTYLYDIKYAGYRLVFANAIKRAQKIFVPSNWVKNKLKNTYKDIDDNKIIVIYEGVDEKIIEKIENRKWKVEKILQKYNIRKPFLIYTGSAYPHKNLSRLLEAIEKIPNMQLGIACARDVFWEKLASEIKNKKLQNKVKLLGFVPDQELAVLYQNALAFVFPSLSEGFGLPGLEAMACGCPVIASDIPVFHEIYGDACLYFDPKNAKDIAKNVELIINNAELREDLRNKGLSQVKKYSWEKMGRETLKVYEKFSTTL